ncbi:addiction module protein [Longimicrobium sp.]|uniref:addiction module protein n=1 Tax=Longimicrobium sp. TaxID=2029185 RepID=UPI002E300C37|nr:addiction module protein [Longimicrobium sp.]HEX6040331.1 addiction module protein [Longimicrobium sp.]
MSLTMHEIEAEARHLTPAERADLAQRLFASIEDEEAAGSEAEVEQAWLEEADRRYARYLAGETRSVSAADALARVRARIAGR